MSQEIIALAGIVITFVIITFASFIRNRNVQEEK